MISLQKAMRLGIASETLDGSEKIKKFFIRDDCSSETLADVRLSYGEVEFSKPLNTDDFELIIQKIYKN